MTVTIGAGSAKTVLEVGKTEDGETYARDASRPMVFTVDTTLQGDLDKNFDDYRKKELFEFRPFYAREAARGARRAGRTEDLRVREAEARDAGRSGNVEGDARRRRPVIPPTRPRWTIC